MQGNKISLTDEEYKRLRIICAAIVNKLKYRFNGLPVDQEDLLSVAMYGATDSPRFAGALNGHATWKPPRPYASYIGQCATNALSDYLGKLQRQRRGDDAALPAIIEATNLLGPSNSGNSHAWEDFLPRSIGERGPRLPIHSYARALEYREQHDMTFSQLQTKLAIDHRDFGFPRPPARSSLLLAQRRLRFWFKNRPKPTKISVIQDI